MVRRWRRMFGLTKDLVAPFNIAQEERGRRAQRRPATVPINPSRHDRPTVLAPLAFPHIFSYFLIFPVSLNCQNADESAVKFDLRSVYDLPMK